MARCDHVIIKLLAESEVRLGLRSIGIGVIIKRKPGGGAQIQGAVGKTTNKRVVGETETHEVVGETQIYEVVGETQIREVVGETEIHEVFGVMEVGILHRD